MPRKTRPLDPRTQLTKRQTDNARLAISTSKIISRLQANFNGELDEQLTPSQLKSAELLISRSLPTLTATEVSTTENIDMGTAEEAEAELREYMKETLAKADDAELADLLGKPKLAVNES